MRGATAGFNTPTFVVDAPGGGGKRDAHSYEHYDRTTGISVFTAPAVHPGEMYFYFDPIDLLPPEGQARWADPAEHEKMVEEARAAAADHPRRLSAVGARYFSFASTVGINPAPSAWARRSSGAS